MNETIKLTESELFQYYLQQNAWAKGIEFNDFKKIFTDKGVVIIDEKER